MRAAPNNGSSAAAAPVTLAKKDTPQAAASATETALTWPAPSEDEEGMYSAGQPTRFTAVRAGFYLVTGWISSDAGAGERQVLIRRAGSVSNIVARTTVDAGSVSFSRCPFAGFARLAAGDYLTATLYHDAGAPINILGGVSDTQIHIARIGD